MSLVILATAQIRRHLLRAVLTVLAIAVAVAVVGFSVRSSQVARQQMLEAARQFGRFDAIVMPREFGTTQLDPGLVAALRADPAVAECDAAVKTRARVLKPELPPLPGPFGGGATVMGTNAVVPPQALADGRWFDHQATAGEAVVSTAFRDRAKLRLGDQVTIAGNGDEVTVTVVGTIAVKAPVPGVRMPPAPHLADLWIPAAAAAQLNGYADRPGLLCLVLRDPEHAGAFAKIWREQAGKADPAAAVRSTQDEPEDPLGAPPAGMAQMLSATTTLGAILAAGFITFLSLSIGVRARLRQYAILRALAMSRLQLAGLVVTEALGFALAGLAFGLGLLLAAMAACRALAGQVPAFAGEAFDPARMNGMVLAVCAASALLGAAAAAVLPVWQVWRIRPVDILGGQGQGGTARFPWRMTALGLVCVAVNPVIILLGSHAAVREVLAPLAGTRGFGTPLLGSFLMIIGLGLVAPFGLLLTERLLHRPAALLLGLDGRFLRQQLTGNLWRAAGTTVALSVGLTLYVAALVWGFSMLVPFMPTDALPRLQVSVLPAGLPDEAVPELLAVEGVRPERVLPMAVEQPRLAAATLARPGFAHVDEQQRHVLVVGIDPQRAFAGADPMLRLDFLAGDAAAAAAALAAGRGCIIPDHFATQCGLRLGDTFSVEVPDADREVTYTVVGIAAIPGWNWLTKFSEIRRRAVRALAIVITGYAQARDDYGLTRIGYFWLDPLVAPGDADPARALAQRLEPIAKKHARVNLNVPRAGRTAVGTQYVNVTDRESIKERIAQRAGDVIGMMRWMPLITLLITSLAVCNTILASVRVRAWQFGILRGIGMTRGQLIRLILGESLLLGAAACVLSLTAGIALAWSGTRLSTLFFFFAGRTPPLVVPWTDLGLGFALAFILCLLAGLIPALAAGRREPLHFIQTGRLAS